MTRSTPLILATILALLAASRTAAQGGQPGTAPETQTSPDAKAATPLVTIRAEGVQDLLKAWPSSRLGKLLADEDCVAAATAVRNYTARNIARQRAVIASFTSSDMLTDLEPWEYANLYTAGETDIWQMFRFPVAEVTRAEMLIAITEGGTAFAAPNFVTALSCSPRYEGRWTQAFEQEATSRRNSPLYKELVGTKIDGFPAYGFQAPEVSDENNYLDPNALTKWMLHMPGTFVYGSGEAYSLAKTASTPSGNVAEIAMDLDLQAYVAMFQRAMGGMVMGMPEEFRLLGLDGLKTMQWRGQFVGDRIQDEFSFELTDTPKGMIGALLTGTAELPAQALPDGALAQVRTAINLKMLADVIPVLTDDIEVPEEVVNEVVKAFDGGIALSCCAPAPGGVIPRIYATLGIADEAALTGLFEQFLTDKLPTTKVKYSGIDCTVLKIPDLPNGIQPAFCRVGGKLHIAESALSLRAFLKAQEDDVVAMEIDDAPMPQGNGEAISSFDLRFDEAALYDSFYTHWLPLYELAFGVHGGPVSRKDLPEPEVVAEYVGKTRGVLRKSGNRYTLSMLGALGGPETAALLMTWGPMICPNMNDYQTEQLAQRLARQKLSKVQVAIEAFEKREQRRPKDLAELFTAQKLADDALLMPMDDMAEEFVLPDGRKLQSSYRYFPQPVTFVTGTGDDEPTVMIEIRTHNYGRATLTTKGSTPEAYGNDSDKPIDQFGKESPARESSAPAGHNHK